MTVRSPLDRFCRLRGATNQVLIVLLINIPTISFGLAFGWISLVSGEGSKEAVVAAVTTFVASLAGVPLSAWALHTGRKFAIIATSFLFVVCWSLKLGSCWLGVWGVVCARIAAGLGGASAWALAPLIAREMCSDSCRGAAVSALPLAHNAGVLLMYLAADSSLAHSTILWLCLSVSIIHCAVSLFMPESPSFLAAQGKPKMAWYSCYTALTLYIGNYFIKQIYEACKSLAWLRGVSPDEPSMQAELASLPMPEPHERSPYTLAKEMLIDGRRRRAFIIGTIAVVGQEMCGILAVMQYAERVFMLAGGHSGTTVDSYANVVPVDMGSTGAMAADQLASPTREAVMLGTVQFVFSAIALYLVERVGRRPLLIWCATLTGGALAVSAAFMRSGSPRWTAVALAFAVATDASGLQPAPYALLADMFHYEYRGCALMLATAGACAGNALESAMFPAAVATGGLISALTLGGVITLAYALFAAWAVPETKGRSPEQIYQIICSNNTDECENGVKDERTKNFNTLYNEKHYNGKNVFAEVDTALTVATINNDDSNIRENDVYVNKLCDQNKTLNAKVLTENSNKNEDKSHKKVQVTRFPDVKINEQVLNEGSKNILGITIDSSNGSLMCNKDRNSGGSKSGNSLHLKTIENITKCDIENIGNDNRSSLENSIEIYNKEISNNYVSKSVDSAEIRCSHL